jgi:hypothetical protein
MTAAIVGASLKQGMMTAISSVEAMAGQDASAATLESHGIVSGCMLLPPFPNIGRTLTAMARILYEGVAAEQRQKMVTSFEAPQCG